MNAVSLKSLGSSTKNLISTPLKISLPKFVRNGLPRIQIHEAGQNDQMSESKIEISRKFSTNQS